MNSSTLVSTQPDKLLTPEEFCLRLGLGRETVRRLTRRGVIKVIRLGPNTLRYRESEIENFISSRKG
jgi:excisionase family DNA binding protein